MFTFDTCIRFTHTYKDVIDQKIIFSSEAHDQFMERRNWTSKLTQYSFRIPFIRKKVCDLEIVYEKGSHIGLSR